MKPLSKFFLAVLFLTVSAVGWAACLKDLRIIKRGSVFRWREELETLTYLVVRTTISHALKKHWERKLSISFLKVGYPVRTNSTELSIAGLTIIQLKEAVETNKQEHNKVVSV